MASDARLTVVVAEGNWGTVECAILDSGAVPAMEFILQELAQLREKGKDRDDSSAQARFMAIFQQMANYGMVSAKRLKSEMAGLCAFRHEVKNSQIRFPCFQDGSRWILTHGFIKPGAKKGLGSWPERDVTRATDIKATYFRRKAKLGVLAKREKLQ